MADTVEWLTSVPVNDSNFTGALKKASIAEIHEALRNIDGRPNVKSKTKVLESAMRRRLKQQEKNS